MHGAQTAHVGAPAHKPRPGLQTQTSSQCSKWGAQGTRKDSKSWTKKNVLSENSRGAMAEINTPARGTFITLLRAKEPRARNHVVGLRIGSLSSKGRKYTCVSLIPLVITKQQKTI